MWTSLAETVSTSVKTVLLRLVAISKIEPVGCSHSCSVSSVFERDLAATGRHKLGAMRRRQ